MLCARIIRNHPLPDGNKRTAFLALVEFVERNGRRWSPSDRDPDESVAMIEAVAAGPLSEAQLAAWIRSRVTSDPNRRARQLCASARQ